MEKEQVTRQLARYKETIRAIKKRDGLGSVRLLAERMNYSRGETISEYGSIRHYKPEKFRDFVELLSRVFDVNPDYILNGKGPMFLAKTAPGTALPGEMSARELSEKIEGLQYARALLTEQLRRLREKQAAIEGVPPSADNSNG
jgi:hypothetical protein